jgi:hypothetical protein
MDEGLQRDGFSVKRRTARWVTIDQDGLAASAASIYRSGMDYIQNLAQADNTLGYREVHDGDAIGLA